MYLTSNCQVTMKVLVHHITKCVSMPPTKNMPQSKHNINNADVFWTVYNMNIYPTARLIVDEIRFEKVSPDFTYSLVASTKMSSLFFFKMLNDTSVSDL